MRRFHLSRTILADTAGELKTPDSRKLANLLELCDGEGLKFNRSFPHRVKNQNA